MKIDKELKSDLIFYGVVVLMTIIGCLVVMTANYAYGVAK